MAYYNTCPKCGCNLDPGEKCDCERVKPKEQKNSFCFAYKLSKSDKAALKAKGGAKAG
jgi:hypothetical protein